MPDLILASTSPYRRALMGRLGVPFRCVSPRFDENVLKRQGLEPRALASRSARGKAESVREDGAVVVGSDQVVAFDGDVFGKPGDAGGAVRQLLAMSGRSHELITAVVVIQGERAVEHLDVTTLWMRPLTRAQIERYVEADRPFDCAGSYKLEERGVTLFERIDSGDHSAVTGLPLIALTTMLVEFGFAIP